MEVDGERVQLDGWRAMAGHNWGSEHAERWIWLHAVGFEEAPDAWLDMVLGRVRVGPLRTPWVANGALFLDGRRSRLGGLARRPRVAARHDGGELVLPGEEGLEVAVTVRAPAGQLVGWTYADPSGGEHRAANCSIAAVQLRAGARSLATAHGGAWELGSREPPPGLALQPYPDP